MYSMCGNLTSGGLRGWKISLSQHDAGFEINVPAFAVAAQELRNCTAPIPSTIQWQILKPRPNPTQRKRVT
ncbi:hypothetical protein ACFX1W_017735 [Malus domestica]